MPEIIPYDMREWFFRDDTLMLWFMAIFLVTIDPIVDEFFTIFLWRLYILVIISRSPFKSAVYQATRMYLDTAMGHKTHGCANGRFVAR